MTTDAVAHAAFDPVLIAPSILSADFSRLGDEVSRIESAADWLHLDVMDGHFVPNLSFGLPMVRALLGRTTLPTDVHLMIEDPDRWAIEYAEAGAASVTFHAEAVKAPVRLARELRSAGARAGIGLNPATPVDPYLELLPHFDVVLIMSVEPGFGGQGFIDEVLPKVRQVRRAIRDGGHSVVVQVDGGVDETTIERCVEAGADLLVAGSAVYRADDPAVAVKRLQAAGLAAADGAWWRR